ncbi:MAG: hypothetical protein MJE77_04295 [Proteobacteria bacterium]|nr:hypothetical protein [Pseudomonadota bacterium]
MSDKTAAAKTDAVDAVMLSSSAFDSSDAVATEYTVIRAERQLPHRVWWVTYKRKVLIPSGDDAEIGKGGEIIVVVDLVTRQAKVSGYGE